MINEDGENLKRVASSAESQVVVPSFHKGGVRGGSCNFRPIHISLITIHYSLGEVTRTTPNPSFMKGGDHEMENPPL